MRDPGMGAMATCTSDTKANPPATSMEICQSPMKPLKTVAMMKAVDANELQMPVTNLFFRHWWGSGGGG